MILVNISIQKPLTDQFVLRNFKYTAIKIANAKKQTIPSKMLTGYSIGFFNVSPNETIENHKKAQISPNAPKPDNPKDITEVFILQCFLTVFENIKQKPAETVKLIPNRIKTNGNPSNKADNINVYIGASAPPIMPIEPLCKV